VVWIETNDGVLGEVFFFRFDECITSAVFFGVATIDASLS
jgi:hypothetical protein